jgi:DNA-directed RNA polymerase subunit beta'
MPHQGAHDQDNRGQVRSELVESTLGRFIFNEIIPQNLGFVDRSKPRMLLSWNAISWSAKKSRARSSNAHPQFCISETALILDRIKTMGYRYSTKGGISIGIFDMIVPDVKKNTSLRQKTASIISIASISAACSR